VEAIEPIDAGIAEKGHLCLEYTCVESLLYDHPLDERLILYSTAKLMYPFALFDVELAEKSWLWTETHRQTVCVLIILNNRLCFNLFFSAKSSPR